MTQSQQRTTGGEPVVDGGGVGTGTPAQAVDAVVATADAVQATLREGQDTAAGMAQQWAGRLAGIPFTALSSGGIAQLLSGRIWLDCATEMTDTLLTMQRRSVERFLHVQYRTAALIAESGMTLAGTGRQDVGATPGPGPDRGAAT